MSVESIESYEFNHFCLDKASRRLLSGDRAISLPPKVFDILLLLVENSGQLLTKDLIMNHIWADQFVEENNLTVRIAELRKILGENPGENTYIETVPRYGYRFVAKVRKVLNSNTEIDDKAITSLAILPLINENNDSNLDYVCDGITESIINNLSQLSQIKVSARNTVFRYKGREFEIQAISQELGVQAILVGRIFQLNSNIIISLELINAKDESQMWGARDNYPLSDLHTLHDQIAKEVSTSLRLKLTLDEKESLTKRHTQNAEAYLLYLKGRFFWNKRNVPGIKRAIEYFQQSIEEDANYALAYSGLADCNSLLCGFGFLSPQEAIPKAEAAAIKALEIDDLSAEAHISLANIKAFYTRDWLEAEKLMKKGIELNPNYAPGHYYYSSYLAIMERFDEALSEVNRTLQIDPLSPIILREASKILYLARHYDEAIRIIMEGFEIHPGFGLASGILGLVYVEKKMYEEAIQEFQKLLEFSAGGTELPVGENIQSLLHYQKHLFTLESDSESIALIGYIYGKTGQRKEAIELLRALKYQAKFRYVEPHTLAFIYLGLEDKDQAFDWLEKSYADQSMMLNYFKVSPMFDSLRSDPRFEDLLRRIGFTS